jgi:hypothetical protein
MRRQGLVFDPATSLYHMHGSDMSDYGISCGYCDASISGSDADDAHRKAQDAGWRMTYGSSAQWGEGAHNTCPDCIGIGEETVPQFVYSSGLSTK